MAFTSEITRDFIEFCPSVQHKAKQIECLEHFLAGRDIIANLPVGYEKSLVYQIIPKLLSIVKKDEPQATILVISPLVISPLTIIQNEQIKTLKKYDVKACRPSNHECDGVVELMEKDMIQNIAEGEFAILFAHPEALLNTVSGKDLLSKRQFIDHVKGVVIDECHIVKEWGEEFRTAFQKLKTLPAVFNDVPFMALSGTLPTSLMKELPNILGLNNPVTVQESPDRTNIFLKKLHKSKIGEIYESIFKTECDDLKKDPYNYLVTMLFMPLYYISQAAAYLKHLFGDGDITTSCYAVLFSRQDKVVLKTTVEELQMEYPRIRLILTSSVAGMRFDPPSVMRIIHARPPRNLSQYLQEIGRAGRRGQNSSAILHYNKRDIAKNIPGIQEDIVQYCNDEETCLRELLLKPFGLSKSPGIANENCCSFCLNEDISKLDKAGAFDNNV